MTTNRRFVNAHAQIASNCSNFRSIVFWLLFRCILSSLILASSPFIFANPHMTVKHYARAMHMKIPKCTIGVWQWKSIVSEIERRTDADAHAWQHCVGSTDRFRTPAVYGSDLTFVLTVRNSFITLRIIRLDSLRIFAYSSFSCSCHPMSERPIVSLLSILLAKRVP